MILDIGKKTRLSFRELGHEHNYENEYSADTDNGKNMCWL